MTSAQVQTRRPAPTPPSHLVGTAARAKGRDAPDTLPRTGDRIRRPAATRYQARTEPASRPDPAHARHMHLRARDPLIADLPTYGLPDYDPPVHDPLELEADRAARSVMAGRPWFVAGSTAATDVASDPTSATGSSPPGGGSGLPDGIRVLLESTFRADLSDVRVHAGPAAAGKAAAKAARAYTVGRHIVLGNGAGPPGSSRQLPLLAHETAHILQQRRGQARVQRQPVDQPQATATPAPTGPMISDAELAALIDRHGGGGLLPVLPNYGGLAGLRGEWPLSHERFVNYLRDTYGQQTLDFLIANDARILRLVERGYQIEDRLEEWIHYYIDTNQDAAVEVIEGVVKGEEFSYAKAASMHAEHGPTSLDFVEAFRQHNPQEVVELAVELADAEQAQRIELERQRAEWRRQGQELVGEHIATRERTLWWDRELRLSSVLDPDFGAETEQEALAWARISGSTAAVGKVGERHFVYGVDEDLAYEDVWLHETFEEHRSEIVPRGGGPRFVLVTNDGYVLRARDQRYFGGEQSRDPREFLAGSQQLLEEHRDELGNDQAVRLFKRLVLDALMVNLENAEENLNRALDPLFDPPMRNFFTMRPEFGEVLNRDAAALKQHILRVTELADELERSDSTGTGPSGPGEEPAEDLQQELLIHLAAIGRIHAENPAAAVMVVDTRDEDERKGVAAPEDIENRLEGKRSGDAVWDTAQELVGRLRNIEKVRRHFHEDPDAVLDLEPLHDEFLSQFTDWQQFWIKWEMVGHSLWDLASALGMTVVELGLVITGFATGGLTSLLAFGSATVLGASATADMFRRAELLTAMSALDVEGGFQLAGAEQARSARRWAYVGLGLTLLDVGGFIGSVSRLARIQAALADPAVGALLARSQARLGDAARAMGMSERQLLRTLRTARGADRAALLERLRRVTEPLAAGGRFGHFGFPAAWTAAQIEQARRALLRQTGDVRQVAAAMRKYSEIVDPALGTAISQDTLRTIKAYLFDSPGIAFTYENYQAWTRMATGRGTVDDFRFLLHEAEEVGALARLEPGFDFLGRNWDTLTPRQRQRWMDRFLNTQTRRSLYFKAHGEALAREYRFLADRVQHFTGYEVSSQAVAVADELGRGARGGPLEFMTHEGVPLSSHHHFPNWTAASRAPRYLDEGIARPLGLASDQLGRAPTLIDIVRAVKRQSLVPQGPHLSGRSLIIDSNAAIALERQAAGLPLNPAHQAVLARLGELGGGTRGVAGLDVRVTATTAAEVAAGGGHAPWQGIRTVVQPADPAYQRLVGALDRAGVGRAAGGADRTIVADAFFAETRPGIVARFATHDAGIYNPLLRLSGIDPATLGRPVWEAYRNGFRVTLEGRTLQVVPLPTP